jgi:hypothetical protein
VNAGDGGMIVREGGVSETQRRVLLKDGGMQTSWAKSPIHWLAEKVKE